MLSITYRKFTKKNLVEAVEFCKIQNGRQKYPNLYISNTYSHAIPLKKGHYAHIVFIPQIYGLFDNCGDILRLKRLKIQNGRLVERSK